MKKLAILIIHLILCLGIQIPNPPKKNLSFSLHEAKIKVGDKYYFMNIDFTKSFSYFTSQDCINCLIYNDSDNETTPCVPTTSCIMMEKFSKQINQYYQAQGDVIQLRIIYQQIDYSTIPFQKIEKPMILQRSFLVKSIFQNQKGQKYNNHSLGLGFDESTPSDFLNSLYQEGKIDQLSYSLYLSSDEVYILTLGGYSLSVITDQYQIMKSVQGEEYSSDLYLSSIKFFGKQVELDQQDENAFLIFVDPNIQDEIILPQYLFPAIKKILSTTRQEPDVESMTLDSPGKWSSIDSQQTFEFEFITTEDQGYQNKKMSVLIESDEFMSNKPSGYEPSIQFNLDQNEKKILVGRKLLQKVVLYKFVPDVPDESNAYKVVRAFAPLKKQRKQIQ